MNTYPLFEYQKPMLELDNDFDTKDFKSFLDEVWSKYKEEQPQNYFRYKTPNETDEDISKNQPFIYFDGNKIKPKNYIGFIKYKDYSFNLYPKICEDNYRKAEKEGKEKSDNEKQKINQMIFLWLQYSNNVILPKIQAGVDEIPDCDFMEFLIYQFAKYTSDLLSMSIYQHYEEISEETSFLKGKLNFNEYIKNCAMGKAHKFHCTYDSFEVNNKFNQIIKYTAKSLLSITNNDTNINYLNDIIFTLDEADDVICTYSDCEKVYINRFMGDFATVLDYCKLFLKNSVTFNDLGEFNNFAFLFRTEVLFEDFITNFAQEKIDGVKIIDQSKSSLDNKNKFKIKPDLIVEKKGKIIKIIDIKYKQISSYQDVSPSDIYQCITYAVKLGCKNVTLLYPAFNKIAEIKDENIKIEISEEFSLKEREINLNFSFVDCCSCESKEEIEESIKNSLEDIINKNLQIQSIS